MAFSRVAPFARPALVNGAAWYAVAPRGRPFAAKGFSVECEKAVPAWVFPAPFEHRLLVRAHHDHRVLATCQALRPVPLEPFGVDGVVDGHVVTAADKHSHEGAAGAHARVV